MPPLSRVPDSPSSISMAGQGPRQSVDPRRSGPYGAETERPRGAARARGPEGRCSRCPTRATTKWHPGAHTTLVSSSSFLLIPHLPGYRVFDEELRLPVQTRITWPPARRHARPPPRHAHAPGHRACSAAYRAHVDAAVEQGFVAGADEASFAEAAPAVLEIGLHHEQQHQELLLTDILHVFSQKTRSRPRLRRPQWVPAAPARQRASRGFRRSRRRACNTVGSCGRGLLLRQTKAPAHQGLSAAPVRDRAAGLVTNAQWLDFHRRTAGYATPSLWLSDGFGPWSRARGAFEPRPATGAKPDGDWFALTAGPALKARFRARRPRSCM